MRQRRVVTTAAILALSVIGFYGCSLSGPKPSQQQVQQSFNALAGITSAAGTGGSGGSASSGSTNAANSAEQQTQTGPPTWTFVFTVTDSSGNTIVTLIINVSSSDNLNNPPAAGESGTISGSMKFSNFQSSGYTFDGTVDFSGSFSISSASNGDLLWAQTTNYTGTLNVNGGGVNKMALDYGGTIGLDMNTGAITSGPTYTGTVTYNDDYTYDVNSLASANMVPLNMGKLMLSALRR